jgi:hypothetical protein
VKPLKLIGPRLVACLVALLAFEQGLYHLGGWGRWPVTERSRFVGWRMLPDQDRWSRDHTIPERINDWGFRDRDWGPAPSEKDPGVYRVCVVGNSMTYGTSVHEEEVWTRRLEGLLQAELDARGDGRRALVMNLAVQGYTFDQMVRAYEESASGCPVRHAPAPSPAGAPTS